MSLSDNPAVNPSLWFVGDAGPEWVVIRAARFPEREAPRPANFATIQQTFQYHPLLKAGGAPRRLAALKISKFRARQLYLVELSETMHRILSR